MSTIPEREARITALESALAESRAEVERLTEDNESLRTSISELFEAYTDRTTEWEALAAQLRAVAEAQRINAVQILRHRARVAELEAEGRAEEAYSRALGCASLETAHDRLAAALAGDVPPPAETGERWQHCRFYEPHQAVKRAGSEYETRWGAREAACATCGEAIVLAVAASSPTPKSPVVDLMNALRASVDAAREARTASSPTPTETERVEPKLCGWCTYDDGSVPYLEYEGGAAVCPNCGGSDAPSPTTERRREMTVPFSEWVQVVPETSSDERMHVLDDTCWCGPTLTQVPISSHFGYELIHHVPAGDTDNGGDKE